VGDVSAERLTHLDDAGRARMVDVGAKDTTERIARARARVTMSPDSARAVREGDGPKGEVLGVARLAGVQAAKQTGQLIPLAHPLPLTFADVSATVDVRRGIVELISEVRTVARTGVEMEAMTACAVAALTVYDMVKGLERAVAIEQVVLLEKRGGRSDYRRDATGGGGPGPKHESRAPAGEVQHEPARAMRAAIITISTSKAAGRGEDESGAELAAFAESMGAQIVGREVIPDDRAAIEGRLRHWAERESCELVLTTGGTGVSPSDVTPEATAAVVERDVPGLSEAMRAASRQHTPNWMLSRGVAGVRAGALIVNFPGSPASIAQAGEALLQALPHAVDLIAGRRALH
jgi:cyclic pyranopterin monophosphate synthase